MGLKSITYSKSINPEYFPLPLCVMWIDSDQWQLLSPFEYKSDDWGVIRAEKDFITDFGSKPKWCWTLVGSPTDEGGMAYVIHDWLCYKKLFPYPITDRIFYEALRDSDVKYLKRTMMYWAVRIFHSF